MCYENLRVNIIYSILLSRSSERGLESVSERNGEVKRTKGGVV
jgi:hypothetical protein